MTTEPGIDVSEDALQRVQGALTALRAYLTVPVVGAGELINPLLDVWAAAHQVHPWVAVPVERLLTTLLSRTSVTADDVASVAEDVSLLVLEVRSLAVRQVGPVGAAS